VSLGAVTRIGDISIGALIPGEITVIVDNIHPMVNNRTIKLTPNPNLDGSVSWSWGWSADFPVHLRPKSH
jgi:hypothetical protein